MIKLLLLLTIIFFVFAVGANAQTIPKSIDKPVAPKTEQKIAAKQKPVYKQKNPDIDGDGVKNEEDMCPDVKGNVDNRGCPESENPTMTTKEIISLWEEIDSAYLAADGRKIVFREDFSNNQNKWFEEESDKFSYKIIDGKYRIQSKKGGSWLSSLPIQFSAHKDFEISATIRKVSGTDGYYFGIILGKDGVTGYHHFAGITGWGNYVFANKGSTPKDVIPSTENNTVLKGNATNYIVIKKEGNLLKMLINDHLMGQTPFQEFFGNSFGFQIWSGSESLLIEVDNLTIKEIN